MIQLLGRKDDYDSIDNQYGGVVGYDDKIANEAYLINLDLFKKIQTLSEREKDIMNIESKFTFMKFIQLAFFVIILLK
jgi:hypothetical protein